MHCLEFSKHHPSLQFKGRIKGFITAGHLIFCGSQEGRVLIVNVFPGKGVVLSKILALGTLLEKLGLK